jgi:hypothetical protein
MIKVFHLNTWNLIAIGHLEIKSIQQINNMYKQRLKVHNDMQHLLEKRC